MTALISWMDMAGSDPSSCSARASCVWGSCTGFRDSASGALFAFPLIHIAVRL